MSKQELKKPVPKSLSEALEELQSIIDNKGLIYYPLALHNLKKSYDGLTEIFLDYLENDNAKIKDPSYELDSTLVINDAAEEFIKLLHYTAKSLADLHTEDTLKTHLSALLYANKILLNLISIKRGLNYYATNRKT